tara:strand:+ start:1488 stop:2489 length:1002 start_codon:yes stop_codon:yes gene_type:complete
MRLNQLAKKVGKPYTRIEKFLVKECGMEEVDGPNTKVSDDIIEKVIYKFGLAEDNKTDTVKRVVLKTVEAVEAQIRPEEKGIEEADISYKAPTPAEAVKPVIELEDVKMSEDKAPVSETVIEEKVVVEVTPEVVTEVETVVEAIVEVVEAKIEDNITKIDTGETTLHIDNEGVIKAPKVELEGIKVMGKIDLPQPKVIEEEVVASEEGEEASDADATPKEEVKAEAPVVAPKPKKKGPSQDEIDSRRAKRLEARKIAEREAFEKENEVLKKKEKAAKKDHYAQKEKAAPKAPKKKITKAVQEIEDNKAFDTKEKYKTTENLSTYQKIVKWFNT